MSKNNESTNNQEYLQWANKLEHMTDLEVSRAIFDRIMNHSDINKQQLELFSIAYEYCLKLIMQNKILEPNLLKIYLQDIKGKDISELNMVNVITLLGLCGINFNQLKNE